MLKWFEKNAYGADNTVASTRIRLARNVRNYPFVECMSAEQKKQFIVEVKDIFEGDSPVNGMRFDFIDMNNVSETYAMSLVEQHLVSPDFVAGSMDKGLLLSEDHSVSIMLNEEDHIRIQVLCAGLKLEEALDIANKIDDLLDEHLNYAFDESFGFLTSCPTNLGTGLRASVMLHLPALEALGAVGKISHSLGKLGLIIRGTYGEGTKVKGAFYQVSNQVTLGISEKNAIENLKSITAQIIAQEKNARDSIDTYTLEDRIFRSMGVLKNARILQSDEFMDLISLVLLGIYKQLLPELTVAQVHTLINDAGPFTISVNENRSVPPEERDRIRAKIVRECLSN